MKIPNLFRVGWAGPHVLVESPPTRPLTRDEVLCFVCWLCACAQIRATEIATVMGENVA